MTDFTAAYKKTLGAEGWFKLTNIPLAGFVGMYNFALEVYQSVMSPVWQFAPRKGGSL